MQSECVRPLATRVSFDYYCVLFAHMRARTRDPLYRVKKHLGVIPVPFTSAPKASWFVMERALASRQT